MFCHIYENVNFTNYAGVNMKKIALKNSSRLISVLIILSVITSAFVCTSTVQAKTSKPKKPLTFAHRGYSAKYPENTLKAFKGAFKNGFDGVECDVWENKSGVLFVHHDSTVKRMTGKNINIWELKLSERDKFPIINGANIKKYKDTPLLIPTLSETLKIVSKHKGHLILHIKDSNGYNLSSKGTKKIVKLLDKYKLKGKTTIIGRESGIKGFLKSGYNIALNISPDSSEKLKNTIKWCKKNNIKTVCVIKMNHLNVLGTKKKFVKYLKKNGLKFGMYTTPDNKSYQKLTTLKAVFAMSDDYVA